MSEEQYQQMLKTYGTDCTWVDVRLHLTHQEMLDLAGPECEQYEPKCNVCSEWLSWHKTGTATFMLEREALIKLLKGDI